MGGAITTSLLFGGSSYKLETYKKNRAPPCSWINQSNEKIAPAQMKQANFVNIAPIGKGKFGLVYMAKHSPSGKHVAIKYIPKQIIYDSQCVDKIQNEIDTLNRMNHPFLMHCFGGFAYGNTCIAVVCEFAFGGELFHRMKQQHKMDENSAKFYFCEVALALDYLHAKLKVVYRDLKPENILISADGHIKLCDFGFAAPLGSKEAEVSDGCGTAMYVAPEIAGQAKWSQSGHGYPVDWWALGCVLFELLTGHAPFGDSDECSKFEIFNNINTGSPSYPLTMPSNVKNLIKGLLEKNPKERFDFQNIRMSPWLEDVNFDNFTSKKIIPPWVPKRASEASTENFLKWELDLPVEGGLGPEVLGYCGSIQLPQCRATTYSFDTVKEKKEVEIVGGGGAGGGGGGRGRSATGTASSSSKNNGTLKGGSSSKDNNPSPTVEKELSTASGSSKTSKLKRFKSTTDFSENSSSSPEAKRGVGSKGLSRQRSVL